MPAGAAIGAGASLLGGVLGGKGAKKAAKKAAAAQTAAANAAIGEERRQFDLTRSDFMPYLDEGKLGLGGLGDLIGVNGNDKQGSAIEALQASPYYQSLYRNGLEANLQNASATGGIRGGNEVRSLADFGADTLNQTIQQQLSALAGLAGMGHGRDEQRLQLRAERREQHRQPQHGKGSGSGRQLSDAGRHQFADVEQCRLGARQHPWRQGQRRRHARTIGPSDGRAALRLWLPDPAAARPSFRILRPSMAKRQLMALQQQQVAFRSIRQGASSRTRKPSTKTSMAFSPIRTPSLLATDVQAPQDGGQGESRLERHG
jgi:hypothetical protein